MHLGQGDQIQVTRDRVLELSVPQMPMSSIRSLT
jgi:hypothetical protein